MKTSSLVHSAVYLALASVLFSTTANTFAQPAVRVTGTVIAANGVPVRNAMVLKIPDCSDCISDVVESVTTDEAGRFRTSILSDTAHFLFIENSVSPKYMKLLPAPEVQIRYLREYRGIRIPPGKSRSIDLGAVAPTVEFLEFTATDDHIPEIARLLEGEALWIQIRDLNGRAIDEPRKVEAQFIEEGRRIRLAIPRGRWGVEFVSITNDKISNRALYNVRAVTSDKVLWIRGLDQRQDRVRRGEEQRDL